MEINRAELIKLGLEKLRGARFGWKDEIPQQIVHSTSEDRKYKVREAWFGIVNLRLALLQGQGLLSEQRYKEYIDRYQAVIDQRVKRRGLTSREDIDKVNGILDEAIAELETLARKSS